MNHLKPISHYISNLKERDQFSFPAAQRKTGNQWQDISWSDYYFLISRLGTALISLGVSKGDRVAIMSNTRLEWAAFDLAILGIGAVTVPIYHNNTPEDVEFILNNCEAKILIIENQTNQKLWQSIKEKSPLVSTVIVLETSDVENDQLTYNELVEMGEAHLKSGLENEFQDRLTKVGLEDTGTILYTSGTTGTPKGVVLTHTQIASEVTDAFSLFSVGSGDKTLTFLPFAHVLGRIEHWGQVQFGFTLAYAESIENIKKNLTEVSPTIMFTVPRIFEKIYAGIKTQVETKTLQNKLFNWSIEIGNKVSDLKLNHQFIPLKLMSEYLLAKKLVLDKISNAFGGKLRFSICGGAPLSPDISKFFHASGILILEGYGLTETTGAITVNTPLHFRFGSVGCPFGDVQIKIAEDGEILIKSKKVMKEYYKNPEATAAVLKNGWFYTGDIGEILNSGDLRITDRKKDLIKSAGGKYIAPQKLENLLKLNTIISQVLIHGDQKKYIVALLTLDRVFVEKFALENKIPFKIWTDLINHPQVTELVRKSVADTNAKLSSFETIKKYKVLPMEFTVEGGELTPSLKVKRKILDKRFEHEINELY